jgi:hypothetical protein
MLQMFSWFKFSREEYLVNLIDTPDMLILGEMLLEP